ncbi:MAG: protein kinase [Acidobacteriota bacterium]
MASEIPHAIGPYRIVELLGQGGMGVVYRARHMESDDEVALKTVKVLAGGQEGLIDRIRREIHALARIRHPNIVRILTEGVTDGLPWYAMELLQGVTLRAYAAVIARRRKKSSMKAKEPWWTSRMSSQMRPGDLEHISSMSSPEPGHDAVPEPPAPGKKPRAAGGYLRPVLTLIHRLCPPLAYLHGEGIVHRDLKPENILVNPNGIPVLVDFGLMFQFAGDLSREALEKWGDVAGTLTYMAPEQARGELVDARADLYSLGCILYELVTGRPPFVGKQILDKHQRMEPVRPSQLVDGVPPALDDLLLRLLAKQPRHRLGHADDLAAALAKLGAETSGTIQGPRPRAYLYRSGFAGRRDVLQLFRECLSQLKDGSGGMVHIGGESGVGKTRLAMEIAGEARSRGICVLTGECLPDTTPQALWSAGDVSLTALRGPLQAIAQRCKDKGKEETDRILGPRGKVLALYEASLTGLPGQEAYPEPAKLAVEPAKLRLTGYLSETFAALAAAVPVVAIFDDLQWADELTMGFLRFLLRSMHLEGVPLLVVGTYRSDEVRPELKKLLDAPAARQIRLGRLDERAVGQIVSDMLAIESPPAPFVRFLSRSSEGNPFFVGEYLRTAVGAGLLYRDAAGHWQLATARDEAGVFLDDTLALPGSLRDLIARRLDSLSPGPRRLVDVASVLGREIEGELLAEVAGVWEADAMEAVEVLLTQQVMDEVRAGRFRFLHDKIRDVAYERLDDEVRRKIHLSAAEVTEARADEMEEERLAALGLHWELGGASDRACDCYLMGARKAKARYALEKAETLYRSYLSRIKVPTEDSVVARNELASGVLTFLGRTADALQEHKIALEEARSLDDPVTVALSLAGLASIARVLGRFEEARKGYERALGLHRKLHNRREQASLQTELAAVYWIEGRAIEARGLFEQALAMHRELGDRAKEAVTLTYQSGIQHDQGRPDEAFALLSLALRSTRQVHALLEEGEVIGRIARIYQEKGRFQDARPLYERALAIAREVGNRRLEGVTLVGLGSFEREGRGNHLISDGILEEAEVLLTRLEDKVELIRCLCERGKTRLARGEDARTLLHRAREVLRTTDLGSASPVLQVVASLADRVEGTQAARA